MNLCGPSLTHAISLKDTQFCTSRATRAQCGKNEKFSHTRKIFREIKCLVTPKVKPLLSRTFCKKSVRENFGNFHTVERDAHIIIFAHHNQNRASVSSKMEKTLLKCNCTFLRLVACLTTIVT